MFIIKIPNNAEKDKDKSLRNYAKYYVTYYYP